MVLTASSRVSAASRTFTLMLTLTFTLTVTLTLASSAGAAPDAPAAPKRLLRVVVMDFDLDDRIEKRTAQVVADSFVAEVRKLNGVSVVGMAEVRSMLEAEATRQTMGCAEGSSCLGEIADALGADVLITGRISRLDASTVVFSLRRVDPAKAAVTLQVEEHLVDRGGEELLAAIGPDVAKLFPAFALKPGQTRGVPKELARMLNPPPLPVWSTLSVGAGAVVVAGGGAALGLLAEQARTSGQQLIGQSANVPVDGALIVKQEAQAEQLGIAANAMFIGAGALIAATGVMALFTDWLDVGDAPAP